MMRSGTVTKIYDRPDFIEIHYDVLLEALFG